MTSVPDAPASGREVPANEEILAEPGGRPGLSVAWDATMSGTLKSRWMARETQAEIAQDMALPTKIVRCRAARMCLAPRPRGVGGA